MDFSSVEAIVFDMDGVIFDSERAFMECWLLVAEEHGIEHLRKNYIAATGTTAEKTRQIMMEAYGADFPYDLYVEEAKKIWHERYADWKLPMKDGVRELLEFLKASGRKIALASSTRREIVLRELDAAGILDYFDQIVCGDMVKHSKPAPDIFLKACERLEIEPARAIAIEDSYNGIRAASTAGMMPVMVPDLRPANEEMKSISAAICKDLKEVQKRLAVQEWTD